VEKDLGAANLSKHTQHPSTVQGELLGGLHLLQTQCIRQRKDFENLFDGFSTMQAISYVVSPDLLLEFFDKRGYTEIEVVVGESLSDIHKQADIYKQGLGQKEVEVTERLAVMVEKGTLRVLIPNRTIHTKLYILQRADAIRVIQTSANLTKTAQEAIRQINYAWYFDLPVGYPTPAWVSQDYETHRQGCSLFMGDLKDLLGQHSDMDRKQLIEAWLKGAAPEDQDVEIGRVFHEVSVSLAQPSDVKEEQVITVRLPESIKARKQVERLLAPLKHEVTSQNQLQVKSSAYIQYVYETRHIPMMTISQERQELQLGVDGPMITLSEAPPDPTLVSKALEGVEAYLHTIDSGVSANPPSAKTSMFEALLYVFFAPFAHWHMLARRKRYGPTDARGPRFMYIYGPSQNGKSTFLRFALKLLTMRNMEPLPCKNFTKASIMSAALMRTAFPLVFDDVDSSHIQKLEDVFKLYWERWWSPQYVSPQIIITSNAARLKDWAKSRVEQINFDVQFSPNEAAREKLGKLFSEDNQIFRWFSYIYLSHLSDDELSSDDDLRLARVVMRELYEHARRPLPEFFPDEPIEKLYDPGLRDWRDLIYELHLATIRPDGNRAIVTFLPIIQRWEVNDYQGSLPQAIKYRRRGNTLIIENPNQFNKWLGQPAQARGWFSRLFKSKG